MVTWPDILLEQVTPVKATVKWIFQQCDSRVIGSHLKVRFISGSIDDPESISSINFRKGLLRNFNESNESRILHFYSLRKCQRFLHLGLLNWTSSKKPWNENLLRWHSSWALKSFHCWKEILCKSGFSSTFCLSAKLLIIQWLQQL